MFIEHALRNSHWPCRQCILAVMIGCLLSVFIGMIVTVRDQHYLLMALVPRAWKMAWQLRTSAISILGLLSIPVALFIKWRTHGPAAIREHLTKTLFESVLPAFLVVCLAFCYELIFVVPDQIAVEASEPLRLHPPTPSAPEMTQVSTNPRRPHLHLRPGETYMNSDTNAQGINIYFKAEPYGSYTPVELEMKAFVAVRPFSEDGELALEKNLFQEMLDKAHFVTMGNVPPDHEPYYTITSGPIPNEWLPDIRNGSKAVRFMGRFRYRQAGTSRWFHADFCGFYNGTPFAVHMCHEHNEEP